MPGPYQWGHGGEGDDVPGPVSWARDVACAGGTPHVNAALSGEPAEQRSWPAECMVSCPSPHRTGSAGPPLPAQYSQNRVVKVLGMSGRGWMRHVRWGVGIPPEADLGGSRAYKKASQRQDRGQLLVEAREGIRNGVKKSIAEGAKNRVRSELRGGARVRVRGGLAKTGWAGEEARPGGRPNKEIYLGARSRWL